MPMMGGPAGASLCDGDCAGALAGFVFCAWSRGGGWPRRNARNAKGFFFAMRVLETTSEGDRATGVRRFEIWSNPETMARVELRWEMNCERFDDPPKMSRMKEVLDNRGAGTALAQLTALLLSRLGSELVHEPGSRGITVAGMWQGVGLSSEGGGRSSELRRGAPLGGAGVLG